MLSEFGSQYKCGTARVNKSANRTGQWNINDKDGSKVNRRRFLDSFPANPQINPSATVPRKDRGTEAEIAVGLSEEILNRHQVEPASLDTDWMSNLKEQSAQFLSEQRGSSAQQSQRAMLYKRGVETLVIRFFHICSTLCSNLTKSPPAPICKFQERYRVQ